MKDNNVIREKSKRFAVRIVKFSRYLDEQKKERIISKQILRSGTSIGIRNCGGFPSEIYIDLNCRF